MNIKSTLCSLVIGSIVSLTVLPIQAESFRSFTNKHERSSLQPRGDSDDSKEKSQRFSKSRATRPEREKIRRDNTQRKNSRQENMHRDRNDERKWKRENFRPGDRKPQLDKRRHDKPTRRFDSQHRDRPTNPVMIPTKRHPKPAIKVKRPKHHITYRDYGNSKYRYIRGPWYYTRYIKPFPRRFHPIGFRINILPRPYIRVVIGGLPYFYFSGVYYRPYASGYIVVSAPIGAFISSLPEGFIAFTIGLTTYYYVNDAYYIWDDMRGGYVVVEKPAGADEAIKNATSGRLIVYPNKGQDEEQQAKDRYECHRWAVDESGIDPTLEDEEFAEEDSDIYRRAIAACLEGRGYTVK
jgi:hypothetical protein